MTVTTISRGLIVANHKIINRNHPNRERDVSSAVVFSISSTRFFACFEELPVS